MMRSNVNKGLRGIILNPVFLLIVFMGMLLFFGCATTPEVMNATEFNNRGIIYGKKGQYDQAISDFNKAIEINPRYAEAFYNRGIIYGKKGQYDQAISDLNKAIEINPRYALAYYNKATACEKVGRIREAVEAYRVFLQYAPSKDTTKINYAYQRIKDLDRKVSSVYEKPKIIITNPPIQRGISIIRQASVTIRGRVEDAYGVDWVTINGQDAPLRSGGLFELTVNLAERNNNFIIRTMNKKGVTAEKTISLTRKVATWERPAVKLSLPNIFALLIGINNYHDERVSDLNFAEQDAQAFYKFLIAPQRGAVLPKRVKLLVGDLATASVIEQNLRRTLRASSPGDMIIIYMAAHGVPDPEGGSELFFLSSDSNMDSLLKTSISKTDLEKMLSRYVSNRKIILITDACHAGAIGMSSQLMAFSTRSIQQRTFRLLNKLATSHDGLAILSASRANELSQEDSKWGGGHGVFTYYLIRGLGGEADKSPSDGFVTLREIRDYLYDKVSAATSNLQTPELVGNYDPNLPIAIVR